MKEKKISDEKGRVATILLVEDDEEDRWGTKRAFAKSHLRNKLMAVENGEEALDYLYHRGDFEDVNEYPSPDLILLDLNLPIMDGRSVLLKIKGDPNLRLIPVVVLTTSRQEEDILRSYDLGVNSYISKPIDFDKFTKMVTEMGNYWFELVVLPPKR